MPWYGGLGYQSPGGRFNTSIGFGARGNPFSVDTSDLTKLRGVLQGVISDIKAMDSAVKSLSKSLANAAQNMGGLRTGTASGPASTGLSTAAISAGQPPGQGPPAAGPGGSGNTSAPVSAAVNRAIGLGVAGEVLGGWGGSLNRAISNITKPGMSADLISRQTGSIWGGTPQQNLSGFNKILAMSATDRASAMAALQQNPFLWSSPNSLRGSRVTAFLNTLQRLNPTLGAAGAAQLAGQLTSPTALNAQVRFGAMGFGGALLGNSGGINAPQQAFTSMLELLAHRRLTAAGMRQLARNPGTWASYTANMEEGPMAGMIPVSLLPQLRQFAASGGNLKAAEKAVSGSGANNLLNRTSAGASLQLNAYESSVPYQNILNNAMAGIEGFGSAVVKTSAPLVGLGVAAASASAGLTALLAKLAEAGALGEALTGKSIIPSAGSLGKVADAVGLSSLAKTGLGQKVLGLGKGMLGRSLGGVAGYVGGDLAQAAISGGQTTGARALAGGIVGTAARDAGLGFMIGGPWGAAAGALAGGAIGGLEHFFHFHIPLLGDPVSGETTTAGMHPSLAHRVNAMRAANPSLQIVSGKRSPLQQSMLYALKGGHQIAKPGDSMHEIGLAADLGPPSQYGWLARNAGKYGLKTDGGEPWHVGLGDPEPNNYSPPGTSMPSNWAARVLKGLGAPATAAAVRLLESFAQSEHGNPFDWGSHGGAQNNPLDITGIPGVSNYNSNNGFPVQNYGSPGAGINATVRFLEGSYYSKLVTALRSGKDSYAQLQAVPRARQWGGAGNVGSLGTAFSAGGSGGSGWSGTWSGSGKGSLINLLAAEHLQAEMAPGLQNTFAAQLSATWMNGGDVNAALQQQLSSALLAKAAGTKAASAFLGDPTPSPGATVGAPSPVIHREFHLNAPVTVTSASPQDAQNWVQMVMGMLREAEARDAARSS